MKPCAWVLLMWLTAGLAGGLAPSCRKRASPGDPPGNTAPVAWPARPANGAPVALVFAAMAYKGTQWGAELRVFSFSERPVRALALTFHFLDPRGAELSRLAYPRQGQPLVGPKAFVTLRIKAQMPRQTDKVTVSLDQVLFLDGSVWKSPPPKKG